MSGPSSAPGGPARSPVLSFFALHLLLAVLWMALTSWSGPSLAAGLAIGLLALAAGARVEGNLTYLSALAAAGLLAALFLYNLVGANLRLARDILRRTPRFSPAIVRLDVTELGPVNTHLLLSLISLTPGSLSISLGARGRALFVHTLYARDEEGARKDARRYARLLQAMAGAAPLRWRPP